MRRPIESMLGLVLLMTACAAPKPAAVRPASESAEVPPKETEAAILSAEQALARELDTLPIRDVVVPGGAFTSQLETAGIPEVSLEDGYVQLRAPFGDSELSCVVYLEAKDLGEVIRLMTDATLAKVAAQHNWVDVHGDQVGGWGYLLGRATYLFESDKGKLLGDFKIAASVRGNATVVCLLDAPGYYASFERALRTFLGSLDVAADRELEKPARLSITRTQVRGRLLGMSRDEHLNNEEGAALRSYSTRLVIGQEGKLQTSDVASGQVYDKKGVLQSGSYVTVTNGEVEYEIELARDGKVYRVAGTLDGKPLVAEFKVEGGIRDSRQSNAQVCLVRDGKKNEALIYSYVPSVEPLKASTTRIVKSSSADADVVATLGEGDAATIRGRLDNECDLARGVIAVGGGSIELERLFLVTAP